MNISFRCIDPTFPAPKFQTEGAVGFDLYSRTDAVIETKSMVRLPSNFIIQVPEGYALMILPRSSLFAKKGLLMPHSVGIIDQDYCGEDDEILLQLYNFLDQKCNIKAGERIAQGVFVPVVKTVFCNNLNTKKSRGGFGSTNE